MARPTLFSNRKLKKLAQRLRSKALAIGHLELIWHAANESGDPVLGDADDVESAAEWQGDRGALIAALMEAGSAGGPGFLIRLEDGRYEIHDYWHHAPEYVNGRRSREDERKREKRCASCERTYFSTDSRSRFCSSACRAKAWRNDNTNASPSQRTDLRSDSNESVTQVRSRTPTNGSPTPTPTPYTHKSVRGARAHEGDEDPRPEDPTPGVHQFGTALCELTESPQALDEWKRSTPGVNESAFERWIIQWERKKGRRMEGGQRLFQARDLSKRGTPEFQADLVEYCIGQDWGSLIPNADYLKRTKGSGDADGDTGWRPTA